MTNTLITICARGGSKGIPGKNVKDIAGKPLIAYTIDFAKKLASFIDANIELSTDSNEILKVASAHNLPSEYLRPDKLSTDTAGKIDTIMDVLIYAENKRKSEYDYIIDLDVTSPLRTIDDVINAFDILKKNEKALNIFSVSPANRNPYFNMVELYPDGFARVVKPNSGFTSRQQAPPVYDMNASFYIYKRSFFRQNIQKATTDFSLAFLMNHICFDLDHHHDFLFMDFLLTNKLLEFEI
jgi:CMP-N,N'-diacetyllegionaminic acid synthase